MSSLLAVMLVTQAEQCSPSLAFVWPPRPQPTPRLDRPVYHYYSGGKKKQHYNNNTDQASSSSDEETTSHTQSNHLFYETPNIRTSYLGFQPNEWADMLTPRTQPILTGRKLELVIDALAIIAHPVLIINQKPLTHHNHNQTEERSIERGRTRTRSGEEEKEKQSPFLKPTETPLPTSSSSKPVAPISQLTRMMTPSITPLDPPARLFLHPQSSPSTRSNSSSPSPVALPSRVNIREPIHYSPMGGFLPTLTVDDDEQQAPLLLQSTHLIPLQSFTLALIIDTPPASHLSQHLEVYYKDVVLKLTAALKHLERESSYLTREVHLMMHKVSERRGSYSNRRSTSQKQEQHQEIEERMQFVQQNSDLARALARIFEDLKALGSTSITLDGQLDLDLLLHGELLDSNTVPENWLLANSVKTPAPETGDQDRFIHLESWKSLLLLEDPQVLMEQTAPGSLLRDFIAIIKPALTLSEYKFLLDTDSNTIAEMTDHLLYWRKAKLTDVITLRNSYQLTCPAQKSETSLPDTTRLGLAQLQQEFSTTFPNLPHLVMILSLISQHSRQPFSSILPLLNPHLEKSESMAVLVWLLKRDLLLRERTHVRIKIDRQTKMKVALWEQEQKQQKGSDESMEEIMTQESPSHYSPNSPTRNRVNQGGSSSSNTGVQVSASLPTHCRNVVPPFSSSETNQKRSQMETTHYHHDDDPAELDKSPQERHEGSSERPLMSVVQGSHQVASGDSRARAPVQAGSMRSMGSSSECSGEREEYQRTRFRQESSVQSDFSGAGLSDAGHPQDAGSDGTPLEGLILLSHKLDRLADGIIGNPAQASAQEQKWLDEICADKPLPLIRAFHSAFRFFNGRYALEEILSRSGLSRKALNEVLNEFKPHLVLLIHP